NCVEVGEKLNGPFLCTGVEPEGKGNRNLRLAKMEVIILLLFAEVNTLICSGGTPICGDSFFVAVLLRKKILQFLI
ncbi:MAG: hypothetical protein Q6367_008140, partial [Candidatus Freyarchaeota archaeon]